MPRGLGFEEMPTQLALWFSAGSTLFFDAVLVLFLARHDVFPVSGRSAALSAAALMCTQFHLLVQSVQREAGASCRARWLSGFVLLAAFLLTYVFRAAILFFRFELTHETLNHQRRVRERRRTAVADTRRFPVPVSAALDARDEWYYTHREWISPLFVGLLYGAGLLFWVAFASAVVASGWEDDFCDGRVAFVTFAGMWTVQGVVFCAVAMRLRRVVDGFFIKTELLITAACALVAFLGLALAERDTYLHFFVGQWAPFFVIGLAVVVYPAALTFRRDEVADEAAEDADFTGAGTDSLRQILSFRAGRAAFSDFIAGEFSVENLLFWQAVEGFRVKSQRALLAPPSRRGSAALHDSGGGGGGDAAAAAPRRGIAAVELGPHQPAGRRRPGRAGQRGPGPHLAQRLAVRGRVWRRVQRRRVHDRDAVAARARRVRHVRGPERAPGGEPARLDPARAAHLHGPRGAAPVPGARRQARGRV